MRSIKKNHTRWKSFFATITILLICSSAAPGRTTAHVAQVTSSGSLSNGGFEDGINLPANWSQDAWTSGAAFIWDSTQAHGGTKSACISQSEPNDSRWIQTVAVFPNTDYRLSGWIRTENVGGAGVGANLSVAGTWTRTDSLLGTNDWTYVSITFSTGASSRIDVAARLGHWGSTVTGTAWFDDLTLESVNPLPNLLPEVFLPLVANKSSDDCYPTTPSWKILVLVYETTDFTYDDSIGQQHHFVASLTQAEKEKIAQAVNRFVNVDIPALNSCNMKPTVTIRYPEHALSNLSPMGCNDYAPSPVDVAADRDPAFDSVITVWDGSGIDLLTGQFLSIRGCAWAWHMGTGQTYDAIHVDAVAYNNRNVFKHEWGHSILFYYDTAGTAPRPAVDNHINDTDNRYVNCVTGQSYILQDETDDNPIPNSIYNNESGFSHDYYSGLTATADQPTRCLGITPEAWASGGPVSRPPSDLDAAQSSWHGPGDDEIGRAVPISP